MTTTLSEGVKVPDVGSVNWAGDLEVNWNLLNGALANLSGNVKTDRDNTWTGEQSFTLPIVGSITGTASKAIADEDGTSIKTGYGKLAGNNTWNGVQTYYDSSKLVFQHPRYASGTTPATDIFWQALMYGTSGSAYCASYNVAVRSSGVSDISFRLNSQTSNTLTGFVHETNADASDIAFRPIANGTHKLGSSSYQWSSVYAQTYYYNGTAWGLDKANVWSSLNTFQKGIYLAGDRQAYVCPMWDGAQSGLALLTQNKTVFIGNYTDDASSRKVLDTSKGSIRIFAGESNNENTAIIEPANTINSQLGTPTNKWKTLNGVNPGALSLPDKDKRIAIDTTGWTYTGSYANQILINGATQTISGWLYIRIENTTASDYVTIRMNAVAIENPTLIQPGSSATPVISVLFPVVADTPIYVYTTKAPAKIYLYECLGNV